jgi:hypothetical protein
MKTFSKTILFCCLLALLFLSVVFSSCEESKFEVSDVILSNAYDFPVKPGTGEWRALGSHYAMLSACQVPQEILDEMSTAGLVETVLGYPMLLDMMAYNTPQQGYDAVSGRFNGFTELFTREDAGAVLLERYLTMDPAAYDPDWESTIIVSYAWDVKNVETILCQEIFLSGLSAERCRNLIADALEKYQIKEKHGDVYGYYGLESTAWLIGRTLYHENCRSFVDMVEKDNTLQNFLNSGSFAMDDTIDIILTQTEAYLADFTG